MLELLPSDVVKVESGALQQVLVVSGSVRALQQASVKAKVAGEVKQVFVREGEMVRAGQVLAQIEQSDYLARIEQSRGALRAAQGQLEIANNTRNNNRQLKKQNFISQNALDTAESQAAIAIANLESAKGALDVAQKALQDTVVRSPIDGTVSTRNVQPGEKVSPDARLFDVLDLRQLEMEISVPSNEVGKLSLGQTVKLEIDGLAQNLAGSLVRISPATQSGSRSILAYVKIENTQQILRVGMFGQAKVVLKQQDQVVKIPASALYFEEGERAAQTANATNATSGAERANVYLIVDNKLQRQAVLTGAMGEDGQGAAVEIKSGLAAGAQIIKTNLGNLNPGTQVKITPLKPVQAKPAPAASAATSNHVKPAPASAQ